ncbi:hypothetical protein [Flavobacterium sp. I-STPA6A]|uniref:hypothetical protein n=1 Tax=Flavobacterium sp. I-STPA6A TaxID=2590450 RepID=UPI00131E97DC|nr:hypothetical protein [Flavobacterium sp. I-STPA6A]
MPVAKTLKFIKKDNGTVLLQKTQDNSVVASFEPSMSLHRENGDNNRFRIASSTDEEGFLIDYRFIDFDMCFPVIVQADINDFLIALSRDFFFLAKKAGSTITKTGDLMIFKREGNTDATKIEINDFAVGIVENQFIRGVYLGGTVVLASFEIYDRLQL